jgi:hypothetical protein
MTFRQEVLRMQGISDISHLLVTNSRRISAYTISVMSNPRFRLTLATEKKAFDVWHPMFNARTEKLRK